MKNKINEALGQGAGVGGSRQGIGGAAICVCPKCGTEVKHTRVGEGQTKPCAEISCPKCGTKMKGKAAKENEISEAAWDTQYINNLPDSAFAYIEPGGQKDDEGKTVPRGKRHFPYKDATGKIDLPHLRNALARAPQSEYGDKAMAKLKVAAKAEKIGEYAENFKGGTGQFRAIINLAEYSKYNEYKPNEEKREIWVPLLVQGWGNQVDNNYYTDKAVSESARLFLGRRKMYLNHPEDVSESRDIRDWAASIQETQTKISDDGRAITWGRVKVYDNWLWERAKQAPEELGTSIIGRGKAQRGSVDGREGNIIESLEMVRSCDFVDYPGNVPLGMVYFVENENGSGDNNINEDNKGEKEMTLQELTVTILKEGRPELITEISKDVKEELTKIITEKENIIKAKEKENADLKVKLDEKEVKERMAEKTILIDKLLAECKLTEAAKTPIFKGQLQRCEEYKETVDGKEVTHTVEEQVKTLITDREVALGIKQGDPIKGMGQSKDVGESEKAQEGLNALLGIEPEKKEDKK